MDATTGALDTNLAYPFTDPHQGSAARVETIAVSPDGATLVAGGNFITAGGQRRAQIAMVDLGAGTGQVADWQTDRTTSNARSRASTARSATWTCRPTGATSSSSPQAATPDGMCDAASRWETSARGSGLQPTWWDRSGGDSYTAVVVTDAPSTSVATSVG